MNNPTYTPYAEIALYETDPVEYMERAEQIVEIYNQSSFFKERLNLQNPSGTRIVYVPDHSGGVLLDRMTGSGQVEFFRIMFAAFAPEDRGKGFLKTCLNEAFAADIDIRFVELNMFEKSEIWHAVGFVHCGNWNFTTVASRVREPFICYANNITKQGTI